MPIPPPRLLCSGRAAAGGGARESDDKMTRQIKTTKGKTHTVRFHRRTGHSQSCSVRVDGKLYRSEILGYDMDGACIASLLRSLETAGISAEEV